MGRPLAKRYFGNTATQAGAGGEGLASVALGTAGSGYSKGLTATVSAPDLVGASVALVSVATNASGAITGYTVDYAGGGYTAPPTVTLVKPADATPTGTGVDTELTITVSSVAGIFKNMTVAGTNVGVGAVVSSIKGKVVTVSVANAGAVSGVITFSDAGAAGVPGARVLTSGATAHNNAIVMTAFTVAGGAARANSDVVKQVGSRRYKIVSTDGVGVCRLVAAAPALGECTLIATDSHGSSYYVTKLTSHKALLTQKTMVGAYEFATGVEAAWSLGAPVLNYSVTIAND